MAFDLSPLAYFRELHLVPRVIFSIGGILFISGLFKDWKIVVFGVSLIFVAVGYNFFTKLLFFDVYPPYGLCGIYWSNLIQGSIAFVIGAGLLFVVGYTYHYGILPTWLRPVVTKP